MQIHWKIWVPILVAILLVMSFIILRYNQGEEVVTDQPPVLLEQSSEAEYPFREDTIPVSGDVDDATESILSEAMDDEVFFSELSSDAELLFDDSELINDISQSYDENDF